MDANSLVREVVESVRPLADQRSLKLECQLADRVCIVNSDPGRLRQILLNLLGNAIKFTEAGTVSVRVGTTQDGRVAIAVSDTGPGIDGRDVERIFSAFTQLDGGNGAKPAGTGLGLALSQEYAALLGGEITVDSELGVGSTFSLTLPLSHGV
jgi:signal transduction histidine kinase